MSNDKKAEQLGEPIGTATARLKKSLLFSLAQQLNLTMCYHCGNEILDVDDLSIEHKIPWLDSENPAKLFYDLNNIAFSHLTCNVSAARHLDKIISPEGFQWCSRCRSHKPIDNFTKKTTRGRNGLSFYCRECQTTLRRRYPK